MIDFFDWSPLEIQHLTQVLFRFKFDGDIREEGGHPALNKLLLEIKIFAEAKMKACDERIFLLGMFNQTVSDFLLEEVLKSIKTHFDHGHVNIKSAMAEIKSAIYPLRFTPTQDETIRAFVADLK